MYEERLLTIEDDPEIATLIQQVALEAGYKSFALCNSNDVKEVYANFRPDVIVLDIMMPGLNGIDILNFLHQKHSKAHILILSGSGYTDMAYNTGKEHGLNMRAVLTKPFRIAELRTMLQEIRFDLDHDGDAEAV